MSRAPVWHKEGWRPAGPGRIKCPKCGGISSSNAFARSSHRCPPEMFRVSASWIEYAHRPGAESAQPLAIELCALPVNKMFQVEIPLTRRDLIAEVQSVAELYVGGNDNNLQAARVVARCREALRT